MEERQKITVYKCRFMKGNGGCAFTGTNTPTGGRDESWGRRCDQKTSNVQSVIDCDEKKLESSEVEAHVTDSGMMN